MDKKNEALERAREERNNGTVSYDNEKYKHAAAKFREACARYEEVGLQEFKNFETAIKAERSKASKLIRDMKTELIRKECGKGRAGSNGDCSKCHYDKKCWMQRIIARAEEYEKGGG